MTIEVVLLALASTVRPTSLAAVYVLVGSESPRRLMIVYITAGLAFTIGFGPSVAIGSSQAAMEGHGMNPDYLPWLNLDVPGFECRTRSGLSVQGTLGATMPLKGYHYDFSEVGNDIPAGRIFPQGRIGIGWWL